MNAPEKKGVAYIFAASVTTAGILILLLAVMGSIHSPAIVLAAITLVVTCVTFMITIPAIFLSMLRNSRRSADYLEQIAKQGKSPAEYANDPKSDLTGADHNFITAVAQEDAIHELVKNPNAYKGKKNYEISNIGQARALRHNLRASDAFNYDGSFRQAIEALQGQYEPPVFYPNRRG